MAKQYVIDCSKFPSDKNCDLKITGSDKEAVIDTAYNHAIGPMHQHPPKIPLLCSTSVANAVQVDSSRALMV